MKRLLPLLLLVFLTAPFGLRADVVRTRDGRLIEGILMGRPDNARTSETMKIRVGSAQIALLPSQIETITRATPAENAIIEARNQLKGHQAEAAIDSMNRALELKAAPETLAPILINQGSLLAQAIPELSNASRQALSHILTALEAVPNEKSQALMARRLQLLLCLGEREKVDALFDLIGPNYLKDNPALRKQLSEWLQHSLTTFTEAGDFTRAEDTLIDLKRVEPALAKVRGTSFYIQWASHERESRNYEAALKIYLQHVLDDSPQIARDRIEVTLRAAEERFRSDDQMIQAERLYELYGMPTMPELSRDRLAQIWRDQGWRNLWHSEFDAARTAFGSAEKFRPGSAGKDLQECEYRQRRAALAPGDLLGHYNLGLWCMKQGLPQGALAELRRAEESKEVGASATGYIGKIRNQLAEADLMKIMDLYQAGEYKKVLDAVHEFTTKDHPTGFLAQAKEIEDMTKESIQMRVAERPQQAEAIFQRAQRLFYQEHYAEADALMTTLMEHYRNTVVYPQARTFYPLVREKLALQVIERGQVAPKKKPANEDRPTSESQIVNAPDAGMGNRILNVQVAKAPDLAPTAAAVAPLITPRDPRKKPPQLPVADDPRAKVRTRAADAPTTVSVAKEEEIDRLIRSLEKR